MSLENFVSSLSVMLKGMVGIFLVTGVIILIMILLNKLTDIKKK